MLLLIMLKFRLNCNQLKNSLDNEFKADTQLLDFLVLPTQNALTKQTNFQLISHQGPSTFIYHVSILKYQNKFVFLHSQVNKLKQTFNWEK